MMFFLPLRMGHADIIIPANRFSTANIVPGMVFLALYAFLRAYFDFPFFLAKCLVVVGVSPRSLVWFFVHGWTIPGSFGMSAKFKIFFVILVIDVLVLILWWCTGCGQFGDDSALAAHIFAHFLSF